MHATAMHATGDAVTQRPVSTGPAVREGSGARESDGVAGLGLLALRKRFGEVVALDKVSLEVQPGRVLGFLGPNGAGKTTVMRAIFGLLELDAGEVLWAGRPVGMTERLRFGYMPEERGLYPRMRLGDQLAYFGSLHGLSTRAARAAASRWIERLGLADRADAKVEELSHGNQQRAQLAAALLHEPELLVLDEPFAGLDPLAVRTLAAVLRAEAARGAAVLFEPSTRPGGGRLRRRCDHRPRPRHRRGAHRRPTTSVRAAADRPSARGRAAGVAAGYCRRRARRALQRRPAVPRAQRRRSEAGARRGGTDGADRGVQLRTALAGRALPGAELHDPRRLFRRGEHLLRIDVAAREEPQAAVAALDELDAGNIRQPLRRRAPSRRSIRRRSDACRQGVDVPAAMTRPWSMIATSSQTSSTRSS